jgi:hypothetical protein
VTVVEVHVATLVVDHPDAIDDQALGRALAEVLAGRPVDPAEPAAAVAVALADVLTRSVPDAFGERP